MATKVALKLSPGERTDVAAGLVLRRLLEIAEANLPGALEGTDPEFLHDVRVSVRRARSVLRELRGVHPKAPRRALRAELKWIQAVTGPVRDLDVQLEEWDELLALMGGEGAEAELTPLHIRLQARRIAERAAMTDALRSARFVAALEAWRALADLPAAEGWDEKRPVAGLPVETVAGTRIRVVFHDMAREGRRIDDDSPDHALHDLRKRGKELRYLLELFGGLFPADVVKPMVAALKELQDVLGRFQDRSVQVERLREEPEAAAAVEALLADQRAARAEFAERFAAFAAKDRRKLVKRTF